MGERVQAPTAEQVRTLAPDASAARAGEELGNPRRWTGLGRSAAAAWGLCQGSGSSPYQAAVDLAGPAYSCSCPSRKIPCKHTLGLLFLLADGAVGAAEAPAWAATWLAARATRAAATAAEPKVVDPEARAKRAESRERKVAAGLDELDRWLSDLVRRGLDAAHGEGYRFWDAMAARLVDAQAAGLGRGVRALGAAAGAGDAWPGLLLEGAARLHLARAAYARGEALPAPLLADVRSLVGWTTREEDLGGEDGEVIEDRWLVIGRRLDDTGQVLTARTYLVGEASGRAALHLAFGVTAAPPTVLAVPGQAFRAALAFYPSATPLRAAVRPLVTPDGDVGAIPGATTVAGTLDAHAGRLAVNPFADRWPVVLGPVVPVVRGARLLARGGDGAALAVEPASAAPLLLAVSGGHPVTLCGEWDGAALRPLGVLAGGRLVPVDVPADEAGSRLDGDDAWSRLVSAALLGTERLGDAVPLPVPPGQVVAGTDRERSILGAAAVASLRIRAGRRPIADAEPLPEPAAADPRPSLDGAAARLLVMVAAERRVLLPEILGLARRSGRRLPDDALPALLRVAADDDPVRAAVAELGGPRAAWLAALVPELRAGATAMPTMSATEAWDQARGGRARGTIVRAMRAVDPAGARDAVAAWLPGAAGDERAEVVAGLAANLGPDDEPLLARALGDRRMDVRRAAADLLARLEGSGFAAAAQALARPLLATGGRLRRGLSVTLPGIVTEPDIGGLAGKAPPGYGERAWILRHLLGYVPPARWSSWLKAEPSDLVDRALRTDEARPVLEGWIAAAERFADREWVAALVAHRKAGEVAELRRDRLVLALPPSVRPAVVAAAARAIEPGSLAVIAEAVEVPWAPAVVDAVLHAIRATGGDEWPDAAYHALVRSAAVGIPPARADELIALAGRDGHVRPALEDAVALVRLRARIHQAFESLPSVPIEELQ